ncbi:DUF421 domain-containing protein [Paenibacillus sp. GCM10027626]|uniref:DUF421 domain-containing protein n=1 Tax=Paenibacillus sp. GCM10027626 TaxID=3273411 RepID=UPI00362C71C0
MNEFLQFDFWEMILRSTVTFIILLVIARLLGKKQLSQLTFFNYITGITIGSIAADIAGKSKVPFFNGLASIVWWSLLSILIEYIGLKSSKLRILLDGEPTIVIKNGKILRKSLYRSRLNLDDLSMLLREKDVFSMQDVDYAVLEPDGKLSILKKESQQTVTKEDLKIKPAQAKYMPSEIISDGKIVFKNILELNLSEEWLMNELHKNGFKSVDEVFYAEVQKGGSLFISKY